MLITREQAQAAADAFSASSSKAEAARALNLPWSSFKRHLEKAGRLGILGIKPVVEGFELSKITTQHDADGNVKGSFQTQKPELSGEQYEMPAGHALTRATIQANSHGQVERAWWKTSLQPDPLAIVEAIKKSFDGYEPERAPVKPPMMFKQNCMQLWPCNDWHIGMLAWGRETSENWDLKIAEQVIGEAIDELAQRSPKCAHGIVLVGGDLLHADNQENKTARSGNVLQVDGRWQKALQTACRLVIRTIDRALECHQTVTVRVLPGNHDEHSAVAVAYYLAAYYKDDGRVNVDTDPSLFFWFRWGKVMIGSTHGHTVKIVDMPSIMAHRRAEDWGSTKYRYVHGFHLHHSAKIASEGNGVICEVHQAPIPQDAWHFGSGFLSGRSMQSITYSRDFGEVSRVRVAIPDGATA